MPDPLKRRICRLSERGYENAWEGVLMEIRGVAEDLPRVGFIPIWYQGVYNRGTACDRDVVANAFQVGSMLAQPSLNAISQNGKTLHVEPKVMEVLRSEEHTSELQSP